MTIDPDIFILWSLLLCGVLLLVTLALLIYAAFLALEARAYLKMVKDRPRFIEFPLNGRKK